MEQNEKLLLPSEVAVMFRVDPKTIRKWAIDGKLSSVRTMGGHRRFLESEVRDLLRRSREERRGVAG